MKKSKSVLALCLFAGVASLTTLLTGCKIHDSVNPYGYAEFNLSAGEGGSAAVIRGEKIVYHIGDEVTIEAKADEHYKFAGWVDMLSDDKNTILSYDLTYTFKLAETNDIEAVFYVKTNLPIYTHIPTDMGDLENYYGSAEEGDYNWLNLGDVSVDHWTFGGWFLDAEYSKELNAENLKALLEGENAPSRIDIYAQLTHNTEEVNFIFYAVDGTNADVIENVVNPNQGPFYEGDNLELQDPSKVNDETYAYEFEGWYTDADLSVKFESITLSEAVTIYGKFLKSNITTHTVTWKVDGEIVETDTAIPYNNAPLYDGTEPAKTSDAQYSYEFAGWKIENTEDSDLVTLADYKVVEDVTFVAVFTSSVNSYTVKFVDYDETTVIETQTVEYGKKPVTPSKTPDHGGLKAYPDTTNQFYDDDKVYTFTGWDKEIATVTGDITYIAQYSERALVDYSYTIKVVGNILKGYSWSGRARELHETIKPTATKIGGQTYIANYFMDETMETEMTDSALAAAWKVSNKQTFYVSYSAQPKLSDNISSINEKLGITVTSEELPEPLSEGLVGIELIEPVASTNAIKMAYVPSASDYVTLKVSYDNAAHAKAAKEAYKETTDSSVVFVQAEYNDNDSYFNIKVSKAEETEITEQIATIVFGTKDNSTSTCTQERFNKFNNSGLALSIEAGSKCYLGDAYLLKFGSTKSAVKDTYLQLTADSSVKFTKVELTAYGKSGANIVVNNLEAQSLATESLAESMDYSFDVSADNSNVIKITTTVAKTPFHVSKIVLHYVS